LYNKAVCC